MTIPEKDIFSMFSQLMTINNTVYQVIQDCDNKEAFTINLNRNMDKVLKIASSFSVVTVLFNGKEIKCRIELIMKPKLSTVARIILINQRERI